jgi:6-phospho-beta-glucosidase
MKVAVIGAGLRTPLLIHGLARAHSALPIETLTLFDPDFERAEMMSTLGAEIARDSGIRVLSTRRIEEAVEDCAFVISSIRAGGMQARARDERIALEHGFAGQETTGPAGMAMALRTIPLTLEQARIVERRAPRAWIVSFTNPAGLITQAISTHTGARVVGICDTPAELFFRIALALGEPPPDLECDYFGLNHLGWVSSILLRGDEVFPRVLENDAMLASLYPSHLFDPNLIRTLKLIPTEYLFFYYSPRRALKNQIAARATRGEELVRLNATLLSDWAAAVKRGQVAAAVEMYKSYLNRRNASYLRLEGAAESAFAQPEHDWDPFEGATGYHRIAVDVMSALCSADPKRIVLNVPIRGAVAGLAPEDVVEVPCIVDRSGARPLAIGTLPEQVRNLILSVKTYERLTIRAAVERSMELATLGLAINPLVGDWDAAQELLQDLWPPASPDVARAPGLPRRDSSRRLSPE